MVKAPPSFHCLEQCQFWNAFGPQVFLQHNSVNLVTTKQKPCHNQTILDLSTGSFSIYHLAEILQQKSTARISLVSTYHHLEQLGYKVNKEEIIGSVDLNRSLNPFIYRL